MSYHQLSINHRLTGLDCAQHFSYRNMTGIEFSLLLVQEPILYVIRKVHRQSPEKGIIYVKYLYKYIYLCSFLTCCTVVPLADYYILGGVVYQCPDLQSIINSRLVGAIPCVCVCVCVCVSVCVIV